jgi:hypothetical protein
MTLSPITVVTRARDLIADHPDANRAVSRLLVDQLATHRGLMPPDWPALPSPVPAGELADVREALASLDVTDWDYTDIGTAYEHLVHKGEVTYTPPPVVTAMINLALQPQLDRFAKHPDPRNVLQTLVVDPSCGAGAYLVACSRRVAACYAARLFGEVNEITTAIVLPEVMSESIFGMDIDPGAVDLCKALLWLEMRGELPLSFWDRNVVCIDTLSGPDAQPPRLAERLGEPSDNCPSSLVTPG